MNHKHLQVFADTLKRYKNTAFCFSASFCYLFAGQTPQAIGAPKENQEPNRQAQDISRLIDAYKTRCEKMSLIDKLKNHKEKKSLYETGDESLFLVGTDACPGLDIPAGTSFTDTGTTIGANNTVNAVQAGCSNYTTTAGPDVIYRFTLPAVASRIPTCSITLTPTGGTGYDPSIYILRNVGANSCPAGTANIANNCRQGADAGSFNAAETITDAEMDTLPAGTYYLFVDSFYSAGSAAQPNRHQGPYSLNFICTTLGVTSANVSIGGKIVSANGSGLSKISVSATGSNGQTRFAVTNSFGFYKFDDLSTGDTYTFQVSSKKYQFSNPTQILSATENITDLNFNAID